MYSVERAGERAGLFFFRRTAYGVRSTRISVDLSEMEFNETTTWILSAVCVLAALGLLWWRLSPVLLFHKRATHVDGKIVNWMSARVKDQLIFKPIIVFTTLDGREISIASDDRCEDEPAYPVGTIVTVLYDPKDPNLNRVRYPEKD